MTTNRQELGRGNLRADLGAPYLSLDRRDARCTGVADLLLNSGVCGEVPAKCLSATPERPSGQDWQHLAGIGGGVNDALKKLLEDAGADVQYERRLASLDKQGGRWRAKSFTGATKEFDAVVIAVPGCGVGGDNLNKIHGGWESCITPEQNRHLRAVQHDQRWAVALFLPEESARQCDAFFGPNAVEKLVKDPIVDLLCYQSRKTALLGGPSPRGGVAVVAHTTLEWARRNARANGRDQRLLNEVVESVKWALGLRARVLASKVITWKQCHVTKAVAGSRGQGPYMLLHSTPPLVLAGDYFTESNFGGCLCSGFAAADAVAAAVGGENIALSSDSRKRRREEPEWEGRVASRHRGR